MAKILLEKVAKHFGDVTAVANVDLKINDKEFFVIVGPSGCGKTTLLRLLAGLEKVDSGNIFISDRLVNDIPPGKRHVQMVFQSYALWPHMKIFDEKSYTNLSFGLKLRKYLSQEITHKVNAITRRVGLSEQLFKRKPDQLSEGQKQRAAVARSMVTMPDVLLMDEPLSNLDPQARMKARTEIRKWHKEFNVTTVYVTHNLSEAFWLADRLAVMGDGIIHQVGPPKELYHNPVNDFVKEFISCFEFPRL